jgi:sulfoxide reductase heme-binding subunit YedZ
MVSTGDHLFWITSRAAGTTALVLASLGVTAGLLMGTKLIRGRRAGDLHGVHEVLSIGTMIALLIHGFSLLGDSYLKPSILNILVPFSMDLNRFWTGMGVIAGWAMVLLGLSYYVRRHIGIARWKRLHRFTALAWLMGIGHALGQGTDAGQPWFLALLAVPVVPALVLLVLRLAGPRGRLTSNPVPIT